MLCQNCQKDIGSNTICRFCGYDPAQGETVGVRDLGAYKPLPPVKITLKQKTNGMAIAALVLSLLAWIPLCGPLSVLFGLIGFFKAKNCRKGRLLSVISLLINLLWVVVLLTVFCLLLLAGKEIGVMI